MDNLSSSLDLVFGALADPTRRAVLERLGEGEASIGASTLSLAKAGAAWQATGTQLALSGPWRITVVAQGAAGGVGSTPRGRSTERGLLFLLGNLRSRFARLAQGDGDSLLPAFNLLAAAGLQFTFLVLFHDLLDFAFSF
jgi:DNA-binding transcriptional ArsR family regulator